MKLIRVSQLQTDILEALAKYKYLTISQFIKIGVSPNKSNLHRNTKVMRQRTPPLIDSIDFGVHPKLGRVEGMHFLRQKGASILINELQYEEQNIRKPKNLSSLARSDYQHRKTSIDFHIYLEKWATSAGVEVVLFDTYFDHIGNNRTGKDLRAKTKVQLQGKSYLIADAIFMIELDDFSQYLYAYELHNGKDSKRAHKQLRQYVEAFRLGSISTKYSFEKYAQVLVVFEHTSIMQSVLERVSNDKLFDNMAKLFLFKSLDNLNDSDFANNWVNLNGEKMKLY